MHIFYNVSWYVTLLAMILGIVFISIIIWSIKVISKIKIGSKKKNLGSMVAFHIFIILLFLGLLYYELVFNTYSNYFAMIAYIVVIIISLISVAKYYLDNLYKRDLYRYIKKKN